MMVNPDLVSPECGNNVFRGVRKCNQCKVKLDLN